MALVEGLRQALKGEVLTDEVLARHTSWQVGGPADLFIVPRDRREVVSALGLLAAAKTPWIAIGAGSNLLVGDGGFRGAVLSLKALRGLEFFPDGRVSAEGGLPLMTLLRAAADRGLAGLEKLAGIPGTVGGAVAMNAGAAGQQLADVVRSVILAGADGERVIAAAQLGLAYRHCELPAGTIVVAAELAFQPGAAEDLKSRMASCLEQRRQKQSVGGANAGSVFKNPPGRSAWQLIAAAGLQGRCRGGARISEVHANFIVNDGTATAGDILQLMKDVQHAVWQQSGVKLEPEVRIVGSDG